MSDRALETRVHRITNVDKLRSFIQVSNCQCYALLPSVPTLIDVVHEVEGEIRAVHMRNHPHGCMSTAGA
jgi:hypothetical protein